MTEVKLAHLVECSNVKASGGLAPYVALEHVESGTGHLLSDVEIEEIEADGVRFESGDVLFGKLRPYLHKVLNPDFSGVCSSELLVLRPGRKVESRYLYYLTLTRQVADWASASSYGVKMPRTSWELLRQLPVSVPGIAEQRAIAGYLDAETARIDTLIAKKRRMIELLEERWDAYRSERVVESGVRRVPLRHLTDPARPIVYGIVQAGPEVAEGVPYIKSGDLGRLRVSELARTSRSIHDRYSRSQVHPGDIVVGMRASIGLAVVVPPSLPVANLTQGTARVAHGVGVEPRWLIHAIRSRFVQEQCQVRAVGTTFMTLNIWDLRRLEIPVPPPRVQRALALELDREEERIGGVLRALEAQVERLVERRQALITTAVSGEVPVPGAAA